MAADMTSFEDLGPNSGLIEEVYRRYVENPGSVAETWREFFADYKPLGAADGNGTAAPAPTAPTAPTAPPAPTAAPALPGESCSTKCESDFRGCAPPDAGTCEKVYKTCMRGCFK